MTQEKNGQKLANQLFELHIQHELTACSPEKLIDWARNESLALFEWLQTTQLNQFVNAEQIKTVIRTNVVENDVPGAIAEIAGEAATRLFTSTKHKKTALKDIISRAEYEGFVDKFIELEEQRKQGLDKIIDLPLYGDLISGVVYQAITRYIYESNIISKKVPGVSSMLKMSKSVLNKAAPKFGSGIEESVRSYITDSLEFILDESKSFLNESVTDEQLKASALDLWDMLEDKTLGEFQQGMDSVDLSEFVVLGYEFWRTFRKSDYFKHAYETVVDYFFEKYGEVEFGILLEDFMITPERAMKEVELFAPLALNTLIDSGQLEGLIRRRLAAFYDSEAVQKCMSNN
ncbi:MAG: hypothetical protein ACJAWS_001577 [Oleiphilaceae bacterium]|jgi:hypothetical protein